MNLEALCEYPFNRVRITSTGQVAFCCFQRPDPLSQESPYLGNLLNSTFDEIWFGEEAESIRTDVIEGRFHKKCQVPGCPKSKPYKFTYNEYPTFLEIDLPNTHCNVGLEKPNQDHPACIMCERAAPFFQPESNYFDIILPKIKHLLPNLKQIHIQGIAEPFYKDLIFIVLDLLEFDNKATISTTTNGTLLNESKRKNYLKIPNSITNFSIDAATPETFQKIRILPVFEQVLENLYAFSRERVRSRQFLRIHNNINTLNVHEVVGMVRIAHKANVEYVEFNPTDGFNHKILVNQQNCGLFKKAQLDIIEECGRLKVPLNLLRPLDLGLADITGI